MNHGETDGKPTTMEPRFPGNQSKRGQLDGGLRADVHPRVRDGRDHTFGIPSGGSRTVMMEKERVEERGSGAAKKDEVVKFRVSGEESGKPRMLEEARGFVAKSGKRGSSGSEITTGDGLVGVESESTTYDSDSPILESSEMCEDIDGWMHGFETGDMVWGKVKSHPWWPGHIHNEELASPSVRRTRKEGHVLVAFFGDSSYGWFDPAELIPFEPYYAEKSRQTSSRNFVRAVEEATDEIGRRRALGLSCRCTNPFNFRPSVPGYFSVDVVNSEFVGVYSMKQIKKAREDFLPVGIIAFVKQLAVLPRDPESGTLQRTSNTAMLLALRKARFEEFDETYAQAFGVEPMRPSRDALGVLEQPLSLSTRAAPLSGPLVFAEALGVKRKGSGKTAPKASRDKAKGKDKYLFKRRDAAAAWSTVVSPGSAPLETPSIVSTPDDVRRGRGDGSYPRLEASEASNIAGSGAQHDEYVLQRRAPADADSLLSGSVGESVKGGTEVSPPRSDQVKADVPVSDNVVRVNVQLEGRKLASGGKDGDLMFDQKPGLPHLAVDRDDSVKFRTSGAVAKKEKKKRHKQEDGGPEPLDAEVKKKKKRKKKAGVGTGADLPSSAHAKIDRDGRPTGKLATNLVSVESISDTVRPDSRNEFGAGRPLDAAVPLPALEFNPRELDIPLLTCDLLALALDPFHGSDRDAPLFVRNVLLKFRSLVYQKSLLPISSNEYDAVRIRNGKSDVVGAREGIDAISEAEARERTQSSSVISKQLKHATKTIGRPDDPTKSGRKRAPSERQEEKAARKVKKLSQLKILPSEKKTGAGRKPTEGNAQEAIKDTTMTPAKASKTDLSRKQDLAPTNKKQEALRPPQKQEAVAAPPKVPSPTFLFMKFPPRSTLPSIASMKVKFGRFGPLDLSGARVYWGSYTCKMLFKYRTDAQAAYMYARNNDVFGPVKVSYSLRDSEVSETVKRDAEDGNPFRPGRGDETTGGDPKPFALKSQSQRQQQAGQLKSCLKKPPTEVTGSSGCSNLKETPRVKFMLDGEGSRREPPTVVSGTNGNSGGGGNGSSSSLPPIDPNGANPRPANFGPLQPPLPSLPINSRMVGPPPSLQPPPRTTEMHPLGPPPSRFAVGQEPGPPHFGRHQAAQYNDGNEGRSFGVDISHEMLNLLRRCSDVVSNVRAAIGYVPYRSL